MEKKLLNGNEASAEAAIRAGCRFFSGYPITPQSEILEYLSWRMPEVGGDFIQTESEIAGINMLFGAAASGARALTSSSGPGFSLMQEGISYLAADDIPAVIINVMRIGSGLGDISLGQGDYWQMTRGGGHGDYHTIVLAPESVQESADLTFEAFNLAEKYRHPVIIASDAAVGQMVEPVILPGWIDHNIDQYDWVLKPRNNGESQRSIVNTFYMMGTEEYPEFLRAKYNSIIANEQRWENYFVDDADFVLVAYGICARVCKEAVDIAREKNLRLGLIRPITLWPFPERAFRSIVNQVIGFMSVEMSILGQMVDDIRLSTKQEKNTHFFGEFGKLPDARAIVSSVRGIMEIGV